MTSSAEIKKEIEERLSEANANEKYLYSRVTDLERRNQRLEKKVAKLKRRKKELKQEVAKLRGKTQSQRSGEADQDKQGLPRRARERGARISKTAKDDSNDSNWSD